MDTRKQPWGARNERAPVSEFMHTFVIDSANQVKAYAATRKVRIPEGAFSFASAKALATLAARWPAAQLVQIWNKLPNVNPLRKFTDRRTAIRRIWAAIQKLETREQSPSVSSSVSV